MLRIKRKYSGNWGVESREFFLLIVCSSLVILHPIALQNGWGEDSATAHSDDATCHRVVRWGLGGGAGEGVSPVLGVCGGAVDSNHKSSAPSDRYQFADGLLSFQGVHHPTALLSGGGGIRN